MTITIENKIDISAARSFLTRIVIAMITADLMGSLKNFSGPFIFQRNQRYNLCMADGIPAYLRAQEFETGVKSDENAFYKKRATF